MTYSLIPAPHPSLQTTIGTKIPVRGDRGGGQDTGCAGPGGLGRLPARAFLYPPERGLHFLRRVLHERLAQLLRRLEPVSCPRQDNTAGPLSVHLRVVDAGRDDAVITQRL